jgi:membrane-associated phospholipid phosphatase
VKPEPQFSPPYATLAVCCGLASATSLAFIVFWDLPLAWYFETELDRDLRLTLGTITEAANSAIWFGLAFFGLSVCWFGARKEVISERADRLRRCARSWLFMIASMATAAFLVNLLKLVIGRYKPRYLFNDDIAGFEPFGLILKMASFPSGHAQSIWSAMIALSFLTPRFTPVYVAVAAVVSATRFLTAVHFVSDVIMSVFISFAVAVMMKHWFERNSQKVRLSLR